MPRTEVSKKNKYYISKDRYYELLHFCKQYKTWEQMKESLNGLTEREFDIFKDKHHVSDPTANCARTLHEIDKKMDIVNSAIKYACMDYISIFNGSVTALAVCEHILSLNIKYGVSYDDYSANPDRFVPIGRNQFYKIRRAFFWHLSRIRK